MAGIHYISIPTIDNCNLPNDTIDKCFKAYERYGKYKIYDILNEELNSVRYSKSERVRHSNIDLIKRYLYLYRIAMVQTMSYCYNTDEFELNDMDIYADDDNTSICPKCGKEMTVLPQRGTATYYPLSHYDDIIEKFTKIVTFTKFPVKSTLSISFEEFMSSKTYSEITDYKFMRWTVNKDGSACDVKAPVTSYLDSDGKLLVYAAYASSATASSNSTTLLSTDIRKTVKHNYSVYVRDLVNLKTDHPTKNGYLFSYYGMPSEETIPSEMTEDQLSIDVSTILNSDYTIDVVNVFTGNPDTSDYVIDYNAKISDLQDLVGSNEKENYTFNGFTYEKYDEEMKEVVIKPYSITTGNTSRLSYIISNLTENDIPWDYMDKDTYSFDYWTINPDGSELSDVQNNTAISASSTLKLYAVFHNVYDETCEVHKMQEVYKDDWGENTVVLYSHYSYNIPEGTYCYDDRAYSCSTSDYLIYPETTITVDSLKNLKEIIKEYSISKYGEEDGHPEINYEDFYGWSLSSKGDIITDEDLSKKYKEGSIVELYAVYKHEHKLYGIYNLARYNKTGSICPICGKKVSYVGNYSDGTHAYVKDGYLNILRYTNYGGSLAWNKYYKNGNNETAYGTIIDISNISTLENMNKSTVITDGTVCVDTSEYADSSNSSYKVYVYNSKRDQNYDPSNVYDDDDLPENCESKWIYIPDDVKFTFLDTTGANKTKYLISGFWKCYLLGNGDLKVVKTDSKGNAFEATLISLANSFGLDSTISVDIDHDNENYKAYYYITLSGYSIDNYKTYDGSEKIYKEIDREVDITYAKSQSSFNGTYPNNVTSWTDKYYDDEGYINDGGYPSANSIKTVKEIKPSEGLYTNGANDIKQSQYKLSSIKVFGLEPLTRKMPLLMSLNSIITSGGISATEGSSDISSMLDNGIVVKDSLGNTITSEDNYSGLNYSGWHWIAEDTTVHYDIDDGAENYLINESNYPVLLSSLLTYKENAITVNSAQYSFYAYSIDGYTPITSEQLQTTFVPASGGKFRIYKIYHIVNTVYGIGIVESDVFKDDEEFAKGGYKRVLFISSYNSTGSLVRYCTNPSCYRLKKPLYQRKWSYKNQNATVKNTATGLSYSNFSLDDYSFDQGTFKTENSLWRYNQDSAVKSVITHRGGSADIDEYRFDFEYKYATDEYDSRKNSLPSSVSAGSSKYKSYALQNILKRIKGTDIVPMTDRPFTIYQEAYKEKLYKRFKEIYEKMVEYTPYSILNPDEINIMSSILQGFSYDLRLEIIAFMNTWNDYTNFTLNEWKDESYNEYVDIVKTNFNLLFNSNKISVGDDDLYLKETILEYLVIPKFNTLYSMILNPDSGYGVTSIKVNVSKSMFGDGATISKGSVLEHVQNYYDEYKDSGIDKEKYTFIRWTLSEDGSESSYDDLNEFVAIDDNSYVTIYAYYEDNNQIEITNKGITASWFTSYEDFVNKYYEEEEFIAETQIVLSQAASLIVSGRFVDGVTKDWFSKVYCRKSHPTEYSLEDYMDSYSYSEFNEKMREVINYTRNTVEYNTGVNENMTLNNILVDLINNKNAEADTDTEKFLYWSFDGITEISPNVMQDPTRVYKSYSVVTLYRVYERKNKIDSSSFNKNWYIGESAVYETIKNNLASFHERMAIPISFMSYMIGLMIWPKRFVAMTSSTGEVGSYFLSANYGVPSTSKSEVLMHRLPTSGNTVFDIENAAVSKRFPAALNTSTGDSIYEQYYITAETNGKSFRIYSFMKNAWIDEAFSGSTAYDYCLMLNNTENPVTKYNPNKLIKIIPYSTDDDYSCLMLIYDNCITFFDCYKNVWIEDRIKYIEDIFGKNNITIKGCSYNKEKDTVYLLTSDNRIITYDIATDKYSGSDPKFVSYKYGESFTRSSITSLTSSSVTTTKTDSNGNTYTEKEVDETAILAVNVANIEAYTLAENEKPWIMLDKYSATPLLPREISDSYYNNSVSDEDKVKYKINEKLTLRYAYEHATISEYPEKTENDGSSYTFVRLSFHTNGINIADYELDSRLTGSIGLYAIYYKDGVEVDEKEGLKIITNEYNTRKDIFTTDLNTNQSNQGSFDSSIFGAVEDYTLPEEIDSIYSLEGFEYEKYYPVIAIVTGTRVKICRWIDDMLTVLSTVDYNDNVKVVSVIPADSGRRTYIVYENQRITELSTYRYVPSIFKSASSTGEKVTIVGENSNIRNLFINYYTDKEEIHSLELNKDEYKDSQYYGRLLEVPKYINGKLTTYTDIQITQTDFDFYSPIYPKWKTYEGENTDLVKIN